MTRDEMMKMLNKEFSEAEKGRIDSLQSNKKNYAGKLDSLRQNKDLNQIRLAIAEGQDLRPLAGRLVEQKLLKKIDSLKDINLRNQGFKMAEEKVDDNNKVASLKKKMGPLNKSFIETLISFQQSKTITLLQISPALGYHIRKYVSIGGGPNLVVTSTTGKNPKVSALASARVFTKVEFFKQRVYTQVEDALQWTDTETGGKLTQNVLAGGGGLIPFSKSLAINMAVLYRVYRNGPDDSSSPWVFRIGISTIKSNAKK
jgi:hypothetical protein